MLPSNSNLETLKMISESLETLVENLRNKVNSSMLRKAFPHLSKHFPDKKQFDLTLRKGVFPYDYVSSEKVLDSKKLPHSFYFYSKLDRKFPQDEDYQHAQKVWKTFQCRNLREYRDLYLKIDVLQLADVITSLYSL